MIGNRFRSDRSVNHVRKHELLNAFGYLVEETPGWRPAPSRKWCKR